MKARLNSAQRALWALIAVSLALGALAFPRGHNSAYTAALAELSAFDEGFKQAEIERSLLAYAQAQGTVPLSDIARHAVGPGVPNVAARDKAEPVVPLAQLSLRTLAEVHARGKRGTSLPIGTIEAEPLGAAIAWRLSRTSPAESYSLVSAELEPAQLSAADVELEREVARLRLQTLTAEQATAAASQKLTEATELFEAKRQRRLPWKIMIKFEEARKQAKTDLTECQRVEKDLRRRYEAAVTRAVRTASRAKRLAARPGTFAIANVLLSSASAPATTLQIPVALIVREAKLLPLAGSSFSATQDAGLWDDVKDGDAQAAIALTREKFTWHNRHAEIGGFRIGGMLVLQLLPALLPLLLLAFLSRMRHVSVSYNPFGTSVDDGLPHVGLHSRSVELLVLVIVPLIAVLLSIHALWALAELPVVPVVAGVAALGLGIYAFVELGSLQNLVEDVVRSHSSAPPARSEPSLPT